MFSRYHDENRAGRWPFFKLLERSCRDGFSSGSGCNCGVGFAGLVCGFQFSGGGDPDTEILGCSIAGVDSRKIPPSVRSLLGTFVDDLEFSSEL
jgi:hypothetical protein